MNFTFTGQNQAQAANGALVSAMVCVGGFAMASYLFAMVLLNQKIRVALLKAGPCERV
ncbi:hypothetical protein LWO66_003387 [Salmonella enterica subsp. enterica serovar Glostrup]|nr:hypothetical protein [Salmonella enterica subsp. enterica serovar Glostrup]